MIRIQSGIFSSRVLKTPKGAETRPTASKLRASFFNMCQHLFEGAQFLDICAGSGIMGLEAISRGAHHATFIEKAPAAAKVIRENICLLDVKESTSLFIGDAPKVLEKLEKEKKSFDLIYFDPPYTKEKGQDNPLVLSVMQHIPNLLTDDGFFFLEESLFSTILSSDLPNLVCKKEKRFGNSKIFCLQKA